MKKLHVFVGILLLVFNAACTPKPTSCADHFVGGAPPVITNQNLSRKTQLLCFEGYAVMHSGISHTPVWAAEHLTARRVDAAEHLKRKNTFHEEERLPESDRAELKDYARSGFDRGHTAPSGDMATETSQHESFSLANMIPQDPKNNQRIWAAIEEGVRRLAKQRGEVYVVTGPIFEGDTLQRLNGRVLVPTAIFKAIYDPRRGEAGAYVTPNSPGKVYRTMSISELEAKASINVFPSLPAHVKESGMALPNPVTHS